MKDDSPKSLGQSSDFQKSTGHLQGGLVLKGLQDSPRLKSLLAVSPPAELVYSDIYEVFLAGECN